MPSTIRVGGEESESVDICTCIDTVHSLSLAAHLDATHHFYTAKWAVKKLRPRNMLHRCGPSCLMALIS